MKERKESCQQADGFEVVAIVSRCRCILIRVVPTKCHKLFTNHMTG